MRSRRALGIAVVLALIAVAVMFGIRNSGVAGVIAQGRSVVGLIIPQAQPTAAPLGQQSGSVLANGDQPVTIGFPTPVPVSEGGNLNTDLPTTEGQVPPMTNGTPQQPLTQNEAVERAIGLARERGLQSDRPDRVIVRRMTLAEWAAIAGIQLAPESAKFGLDPQLPVWVVAMKGNVVWSGPGQRGSGPERFDGITVVLNEATGEMMGSLANGPGQPLPLSAP